MAYVVCEPCHDCKYTDCVVVCPCDCFYQDEMLLYIDPADCIHCDACMPECPVEAIYPDTDVPALWNHYIALNTERSTMLKASGEGHLCEKMPAKEGAGCKKRK